MNLSEKTFKFRLICHSENKNVTKLTLCQTEVKVAMQETINGTSA